MAAAVARTVPMLTREEARARAAAADNRPRLAHLAHTHCATCHGIGVLFGRRSEPVPCNCVYRTVFRHCLSKYHNLGRMVENHAVMPRRRKKAVWEYPGLEFRADFELIARRTLAEREWQVFWLHKLQGFDWKLCCLRLKLDRGNFFHAVYRMETQLGKALMTVKPFALHPVDGYFAHPKAEWARSSIWEWQTRARP